MRCIRSHRKSRSTIVNGKSVRIRVHNRSITATAVTAALLLSAALTFAQESTSVTHFLDSNTDRVPLLTAFPSYPSIARRDRIQGQATVCFMIKQDGRITRVRLKETTHRIFRRPALKAIKKSSFEELAPNQILATAKTCRTYRFRLEPILVDNTAK